MKKIVLVSAIIMVLLFAGEVGKALPKKASGKMRIRNWPEVVNPAPNHLKLRKGAPPPIEPLDIQKAKESLRPSTAKKITIHEKKSASQCNAIPSRRAEMLASYKATVQKQQAELEIKNMVQRGASDEEIEAFKMATNEKMLTARHNIMKAFGSKEEINKTEEAIRKFNSFKKAKEEK